MRMRSGHYTRSSFSASFPPTKTMILQVRATERTAIESAQGRKSRTVRSRKQGTGQKAIDLKEEEGTGEQSA